MMPKVRVGETLTCKRERCGEPFVCEHPRQRYCSRKCAIADKETRAPRIQKQRERHKKWREKNADNLRQKRREWYASNKEEISKNQKAYRASLPREIVLERRARHYEAGKERLKKHYHATRAFLPWLNAYRGSKSRAKKHNIPFTLTKEWAARNWTGRCAITNIEFVLSTRRSPYLFSPSLDRIIPEKGYTADNSRFVLHAVNALKGAGSDTDMLLIAKAVIENYHTNS